MDQTTEKTYILNANMGLRFVILDSSQALKIYLFEGTAEIFGAEMILNKIYSLSSSFAVYTTSGCVLKFDKSDCKHYRVKNNSVVSDLHTSLEKYRIRAEKNNGKGPITLVAGPRDAGKSTLCNSLLNYAARCGRKPLFIDLDVGQSSISIPGTLSILPIESPADIEKGFDDRNVTAYYFGYKSPGLKILLYFLLINKLGETFSYRVSHSKEVSVSGAVIDTCGWTFGDGYRSIIVAARAFNINVLVVLSEKELYRNLIKDMPSDIEVKFISKFEGVVTRSQTVRRQKRNNLIQEYFYGVGRSLEPYTFEINFSEVQIYRASSPKINVSIDKLNDLKGQIYLLPVAVSPELLYKVLALSYANNIQEAIFTSVFGFIYITGVDMSRQVLTGVSPQPSPLPSNILIMGDIDYQPENS